MDATNLLYLATVLTERGYNVVYDLSQSLLAMPQCRVRVNEYDGTFTVDDGQVQTEHGTVDSAVAAIDRLSKFVRLRIRAECEVILLVTGEVTAEKLLETNPEFRIDPTTVKIITQEITNGVHGT